MPVYGRLSPHPEETHPRVKLRDHLDYGAVATQPVVDYASKVTSWPVFYNFQIGDCTCAAIAHSIQAWTAYAGQEFTAPDLSVLAMYEALSGFNPQTHANDTGCVEQDVLEYMRTTGLDGHKIVAYAQVNIHSPLEMHLALQMFGTLYLGIQCPQSAEQQAQEGKPWDVEPGSPIAGGHAIVAQKWDENYIYVVSWGQIIPMTQAFWDAYGEEAWAIVTQDFIEANGMSPSGLNLQGLLSEFHSITGTPMASPRHAAPNAASVLGRAWNWLTRQE